MGSFHLVCVLVEDEDQVVVEKLNGRKNFSIPSMIKYKSDMQERGIIPLYDAGD
jgi:hypothetical protein